MMYKNSPIDDFVIGLKRHLAIAQDTSRKKNDRLESLTKLQEVLEYIHGLQPSESEILDKFFNHLLKKVLDARVTIHTKPMNFDEELNFINLLNKIDK